MCGNNDCLATKFTVLNGDFNHILQLYIVFFVVPFKRVSWVKSNNGTKPIENRIVCQISVSLFFLGWGASSSLDTTTILSMFDKLNNNENKLLQYLAQLLI